VNWTDLLPEIRQLAQPTRRSDAPRCATSGGISGPAAAMVGPGMSVHDFAVKAVDGSTQAL